MEITGPTDRKMIINALNSGRKRLHGRFRGRQLAHLAQPDRRPAEPLRRRRRHDQLHQPRREGRTASTRRRPRSWSGRAGWHLPEKHVCLDGKPMPGFAVRFRPVLLPQRPKVAGPRAAARTSTFPSWKATWKPGLWNDVFLMAQDELGIPRGSIRATVLIETIPAAFEMDEILYELREHSAGLNCGRWDYIFSIIKKFRKHPEFTMPDRAQVTMTTHCMHSYSLLAIKTCHRRGIHAIGGMAAQIPIKNDPAGQRRGPGEGAGRQGPRGGRRPRRHLGGPSRAWCRWPRRPSTPACRSPTRSPAAATTCR